MKGLGGGLEEVILKHPITLLGLSGRVPNHSAKFHCHFEAPLPHIIHVGLSKGLVVYRLDFVVMYLSHTKPLVKWAP